MKCISCGANTVVSTTTDVTDLGKCLIIVRNVPCHKCLECDEIIYTGDVVKQLEEITITAKQAVNEIAIVDFNNKVA
jgi:YgiT-type zinc finger domain-containing protein